MATEKKTSAKNTTAKKTTAKKATCKATAKCATKKTVKAAAPKHIGLTISAKTWSAHAHSPHLRAWTQLLPGLIRLK